jgi:RNA-splicing ligase RtcB
MHLTNLSSEPDHVILGWLRRANALPFAERVISLPDTCPGKSPLPTGTGFLTSTVGWRRFALSDVGCGIGIVRTRLGGSDLDTDAFRQEWDALCADLASRRNKGLGDLGSGNHFLDAVVSHRDQSVCLVVHTGSRQESGLVDHLVDSPKRFDAEFRRIREWARSNRAAVLDVAERRLGRFINLTETTSRLDRDHNHFEEVENAILIRKGSQRVEPGGLALVPSSLLDDMILIRANERVNELLQCLPHGTGRTMSRSDAKKHADSFDFAGLRARVYIPDQIDDASLRTETPACYRSLDDALTLIQPYVEVVERFTPRAYIGQL